MRQLVNGTELIIHLILCVCVCYPVVHWRGLCLLLLGPRFQFPGWQPCLPLFFSSFLILFLLDASARPSWWIPAAAAAAAFLLLYTDNHGSWTEGLGIHHLDERQINISEDGGGGGGKNRTSAIYALPCLALLQRRRLRKEKKEKSTNGHLHILN